MTCSRTEFWKMVRSKIEKFKMTSSRTGFRKHTSKSTKFLKIYQYEHWIFQLRVEKETSILKIFGDRSRNDLPGFQNYPLSWRGNSRQYDALNFWNHVPVRFTGFSLNLRVGKENQTFAWEWLEKKNVSGLSLNLKGKIEDFVKR